MNAFVAELIGTAVLILLGNGVVCNVVLQKTKGNGSGWIVITAGWGVAVFVGACIASASSGAHLNPALTIARAAIGEIGITKAASYVIAQFLGAMLGSTLAYLFYKDHFSETIAPADKLACFATSPALPGNMRAFFCEAIGTFVLVFTILHLQSPEFKLGSGDGNAEMKLGSVGLIPVALLVFGIGLSLGGTTGYAINPARDFAPRLVHQLLPISGKGDSQWSYAWIPFFGPIVGGLAAAYLSRWIS